MSFSRLSRRRFLTAATAVSVAATPLRGLAAAEASRAGTLTEKSGCGDGRPRVVDLGEPVVKVQVLSSGIGRAPDGTPLGYYVASGNQNVPAEFAVVDLNTKETILNERLPFGAEAKRALDVSTATGHVYFATSDDSHLYRYVPGSEGVVDLGPIPDGQRAWSVSVGEDGMVWIGTYPDGRLYSYDPAAGAMSNHGQAVAGEQYVNAIEPVGADTVYVGTQKSAKVAEFNRATGAFTELDMPAGHAATAIRALDFRAGLLFVSTGSLYVRNLATDTWIDEITGAKARVSPVDPNDRDKVYLQQGRAVMSYSMSTGELAATGVRPNASPESWGWVYTDSSGDRPLLGMTYWKQGRTYGLNLHGGNGFYLVPDLEGAGAPLISLGAGPDGSIYAGAYLSPPGIGKYDPDRAEFELLRGTGQVEGFGTFRDTLVFGRYPQGSLYRYDPASAWDRGSNPEPPFPIGHGQSRPVAFVELAGAVAVASVPKAYEGAITLWQPDDGSYEVYRPVVSDQTPIALVQNNGVLIGGTSIHGGYGYEPRAAEAVLFAWDPDQKTTLWEAAPVPGATTIGGLVIAEDGHLWGIANNRTVFEFDLATSQTLRTIEIDSGANVPRYSDDNRLLIDHGRLFGSAAGRLFFVDRVLDEVRVLYGDCGDDMPVRELAQDRYGDLYLIGRSTHVVRFELPADVTAPVVKANVDRGSASAAAVWLEATDDTDESPTIHVRLGSGAWQEYHPGDQPLVVPPGTTLYYRAIDRAWNSSPVHTHSPGR